MEFMEVLFKDTLPTEVPMVWEQRSITRLFIGKNKRQRYYKESI